MIFTRKELEENTIDPKEKSGKAALDPDRIKLIFDEHDTIYFPFHINIKVFVWKIIGLQKYATIL